MKVLDIIMIQLPGSFLFSKLKFTGYIGTDFFMFKVKVGSIKSSGANVAIHIGNIEKPLSTPKKTAGGNRAETLKRRLSSKRNLKTSPNPAVNSAPLTPDIDSNQEAVDYKSSTYSQISKQSKTFKHHHTDRIDPSDLL